MHLKPLLDDIRLSKLLADSFEVISLLNSSFEVIYRSPNAKRITGWAAQEHLGSLKDLIHPDDVEGVIQSLHNISKFEGLSKSCVFRTIGPDDTYIWIESSFTNMLGDPDVNAIVCHSRDISSIKKSGEYAPDRSDITERKLSEEKLRQEEHHFKLLESVITNTRDAILITEAEPQNEPGPRIIYVNEAFTKMTGYAAEEVIGKTPRILQGPKTDRKELDRLKECLLKWESCEITIINYKKNGEEFWINLTVTPVANEKGWYTHWISVERDITESRELEDLLDKVTTLAGIGGWLVDLVKNTIFWSPMTRTIHEVGDDYEPEMLSGLSFYKEEKDRDFIENQISQAIEKGLSFDFEAQIITARNNVKWVRVIGEPEFENNKCVRIRGSFQDIDVRKKAELTAAEALEEKNIILESIGDAFFAVDRNWIVTYWNNIAETVLNTKKPQVEGKNLWDVFSDAVGSESYKKYFLAVDTNQAVHFEDFYPPLGKWYEISAFPSSNGLSVYFKDITDRKIISSALEESERNYSSLFQLSPLPMWVFDVETLNFLDVNQAAIENYGYSRDEFLAMTIMDIRPREELQHLRKALDSGQSHGAVRQGIFKHRKKNGELIKVDIQSNHIQYKGKPAKVITANDMTERFNYVQAIEKQNAKLREIAFMQSHVLRAPLARIMGIVPMLQNWETFVDEREKLLEFLLIAAVELDDVVKNISGKTV